MDARTRGTGGGVCEVFKVGSQGPGCPIMLASGGTGRGGPGTPCPGPSRLLGWP